MVPAQSLDIGYSRNWLVLFSQLPDCPPVNGETHAGTGNVYTATSKDTTSRDETLQLRTPGIVTDEVSQKSMGPMLSNL